MYLDLTSALGFLNQLYCGINFNASALKRESSSINRSTAWWERSAPRPTLDGVLVRFTVTYGFYLFIRKPFICDLTRAPT